MNTRHIFFKVLNKLMAKDRKIILIVGDLGYSYIEEVAKNYPDRVMNIGTMECSMIGIACGLAKLGYKPYVYSTVPFLLYRPLEFIRNDVVDQKMNVKLIGVSMSGFLGISHNLLHSKEDLNVCKNIKLESYAPNLKQLESIIIKTYKSNKAVYIRL